MFLVHLLLMLVVITVLVLQLITPIVLNIPLMAFSLIILLFTIWSFRRARRNSKFPLVASLALGFQGIFFLLSVTIFAVITVPHETAEDSPAVVQGIRNFLIGRGLIEKPRAATQPVIAPQAEEKAPETVNAPEAGKVEIKIE